MKFVNLFYLILMTFLVLNCGDTIQEKAKKNDGDVSTEITETIPTAPWITQIGTQYTGSNLDLSRWDVCQDVAVDGNGNVYCAGYTYGNLDPSDSDTHGNGGSADVFVMKLSPDGVVQWVTQLGSHFTGTDIDVSAGDFCYGVGVDNEGNVYCAGYTNGNLDESEGGNHDSGGGIDAFVVKLDTYGSVQWVTQLGSQFTGADINTSKVDVCYGLTVDGAGNSYCAGYTTGNLDESDEDYHGNGGGSKADAFVMKLNTSGEVVWVTQLGSQFAGSDVDVSDHDYCRDVSVDASGNVYCGGFTDGNLDESDDDIHGNGGETDAFVMKLNSSGEVQWVTQLGSHFTGTDIDVSSYDYCTEVAATSSGDVYCGGYTRGNVDVSEGDAHGNGGIRDAFVMKLNTSGDIQWVTQFGSHFTGDRIVTSGDDFSGGIAVDSFGDVYLGGYTSGNLDESDQVNHDNGGGLDAYVLKLDSDGNLMWVTQLGNQFTGTDIDTSESDNCYGVAVDSVGNIYCAGDSSGNLDQSDDDIHGQGGNGDAFIMKINAAGNVF